VKILSARRIARELAVILLSQLPKNSIKLEKTELDELVSKAVAMLHDYAKENLAEVEGLLSKTYGEITDIEIDHPTNVRAIAQLLPVNVNTAEVRDQLGSLKRAFNLINEALDIPILVLESSSEKKTEVKDFLLRLVNTYIEHQEAIDNSIKEASTKWEIGRMVNIDLDILRLACAETFFMPDIPIAVAINEAVELCHRFADEKAAKFINGILADLSVEAIKLREDDVARKQSKI
jgi:transcription antitermination protein NusB